MVHRPVLAFFFLLASCACLKAEVTDLPFFLEPASFPLQDVFCGHSQTWLDFEQGLNQQDAPDFGHDFNVGGVFQVFATPKLSWSLMGNEVFEFGAFPGSPLLFDPRAILTNVIVMSDFRLGEATAELWLEHDCNHSVDQSPLRDAVHTSIAGGLSMGTKERSVLGVPLTFGLRAQETVTVPLYYQGVSPEPKLEDTSLEFHWVPLGTDKNVEFFVDAKGALIVSRTDTAVAASPVSFDARGALGVDFLGEKGKVRLFMRLDRTSDPEVSNTPAPSVTAVCGIETIFQ